MLCISLLSTANGQTLQTCPPAASSQLPAAKCKRAAPVPTKYTGHHQQHAYPQVTRSYGLAQVLNYHRLIHIFNLYPDTFRPSGFIPGPCLLHQVQFLFLLLLLLLVLLLLLHHLGHSDSHCLFHSIANSQALPDTRLLPCP